jgi:hypothetical protein
VQGFGQRKIMVGSFLSGLRGAQLLVLAGALVLCGIAWINNAIFYTRTPAEVLRVEERCFVAGTPKESAINCTDARPSASDQPLRRYRVVHVRYTSPADGRLHDGVLYPTGNKGKQAATLRPGDRWPIFAHDTKAGEIKLD